MGYIWSLMLGSLLTPCSNTKDNASKLSKEQKAESDEVIKQLDFISKVGEIVRPRF